MEMPLVSVLSITYLVKCVDFIMSGLFLGPYIARIFIGMALEFFEKLLLQLDIIILFLIL